MGLESERLRASYEIYMGHGNSSSATFFSVLKRLLDGEAEGREYVVGSAFGPGIAVEMAVFKRLDGGRRTGGEGDRNGVMEEVEVEVGSGSTSPAETLVAEEIDAQQQQKVGGPKVEVNGVALPVEEVD